MAASAESNPRRYEKTFAAVEAEVASFKPANLGYWNTKHALLDVHQFIDLFELSGMVADAVRAIVGRPQGNRPICHSYLVRSPITWTVPLLKHTDWTPEQVVAGVRAVRAELERAGLRPLGPPFPVISPDTSVMDLIQIFGDEFIPTEKAFLLEPAGVPDLRTLLEKDPKRILPKVPLMPADMRTLARTLASVGYRYPYTEQELLNAK